MEASSSRSSRSTSKSSGDAGAGEVQAAMDAEQERGYRGFSPHNEAGRDDTLEADDDKRSGAFGEAEAAAEAIKKANELVTAAP